MGVVAIAAGMGGCMDTEKPPVMVQTELPVSNRTTDAEDASMLFWNALHADRYADLPAALTALQAQVDAHPDYAKLNMLTGMAYAWMYFSQYDGGADAGRDDPATQARVAQAGPLALKYLLTAQKLAPADRILPGFVATMQFLLARQNHDQAAEDAAYTAMLANTQAYPQFQGIIQGWVLTAMYPADSPRFADGMDGYFAALDACVGFKVSRSDPTAPEFVFNILAKADPACYDTNIAPHNLDGTFLGLGDAYAKQGKLKEAQAAYGNAMRVPSYGTWTNRHLLETRLEEINELQADFAATSGQVRVAPGKPAMFFQAYYSCTGCHQG